MAFVSLREGSTWVLRAEAATGDLKALWQAPGVGDRNYIHRGMNLIFDDVDGRGICGNRVCMAPRSQKAVFTCERSLYAVDIETCECIPLLQDCGEEWIFGAPSVDPDERWAAITLSSAHPELIKGIPLTRGYKSFPDHRLRIVRVPLDGTGREELLYEHAPAQSAHCAFSPTDGNLLYFDLDLPPDYWGGGDGNSPRIMILDIDAAKVRPLKDVFPGPFQTHTAWLWDGSGMGYHGGLPGGGEYAGVAALDGTLIWEQEFPEADFYGHNTPDAKRPALIIDGIFSRDKLQWLYYDGGHGDEPALEPICLHNTEWRSLPGQYTHPHPLTDSQGQWVSFTSARHGRTDVSVVDISE